MTLPEDFKKYTQELMGEELYRHLERGITEEEAPTSIRLNPFKCKKESKVDGDIIPWCPETGRYLKARPNFTFDPLLHAGIYYVQEAASMFIDLAIKTYVKSPVVMLDLCAAPGGKSTAVRAALPEGSLLFSNEPMGKRAQILSENIQKFGHPEVIVTNNYPREYKKSKLLFDVILTDVPCSGEGMFRKDSGAIDEWSVENVNNCWKLQREIIEDIWNCLKPGGLLVYSTCTFNAHEDEENVNWILDNFDAQLLPLPTENNWHITGSFIDNNPVFHFLPGISKGEGLFMAVIRKGGEYEERPNKKKNKGKKENKQKDKMVKIPTGWLNNDQEWCFQSIDDSLYAIPQKWEELYKQSMSSLRVIHAGVKLGTIKGKDLIPSQSLALSTSLNLESFPQEELNYEEAISYLRKEAVPLSSDVPKGYVLMTYQGFPLGWEKNLGSRANNLYPQEWRIKSTHIPEDIKPILTW